MYSDGIQVASLIVNFQDLFKKAPKKVRLAILAQILTTLVGFKKFGL